MIKKLFKAKAIILICFLVLSVLSLISMNFVGVNFSMTDYLPASTPSTIGTNLMEEEFTDEISNIRVMIRDVTIPEALEYKAQLEKIDGVHMVQWLDDDYDLSIPLEMYDTSEIEKSYKDNIALMTAVVSEDTQEDAISAIKELLSGKGLVSGNPVDTVAHRQSTGSEMKVMMRIILPLIFIILLVTTSSWIEPVLFMVNIGIAILINMGTNIFFGEISFITKTTSMILQLACSMDYAIILLDEYKVNRQKYDDSLEAMVISVKKGALSIISSGLTTVVGFAVLAIMQFKIGADMGFVLSKGIICSLLTTLLLMPCLILYCYKWIVKTTHKPFLPSFSNVAKVVAKTKYGVAAIVAILIVPCILAQDKLSFTYGMSSMAAPDSQVAMEKKEINEIFGETITFAIIVPSGEPVKEEVLTQTLKDMPEITNVISYSELVGNIIPSDYIDSEILSKIQNGTYNRMIIQAALDEESDETFAFIEYLRDAIHAFYDDYYLVGESVSVYDLKDTVVEDKSKVNLLSILAIGIILLFNFKSLSLPLFLLLTIESGIFINTAYPYFSDTPLNYVGYLIISSVQLGATVDYAILFTNHYMQNRKKANKYHAIFQTIEETFGSILTSGIILTSAGLIFGFVSSNGIISQLGILIARGTTLSVLTVTFILPALLIIFDKLIQKTTIKTEFLVDNKQKKRKRGRYGYEEKLQ